MTFRNSFARVAGAAALLSLGLIFTGTAANAQQPGKKPGQGAGKRNRQGRQQSPVVAAFKTVNPTAEQEAKFKPLQDKFMEDVKALRAGGGQPDRQKLRDLSQKFRDDVEALLTDDQKKAFRQAVRAGNQRGLLQALAPLNLTEEQKTKIEPIAKSTQEDLAKLQQDASLDGPAKRQKATQVVEDFKAKVRSLLTAEQQKQLDAMKFPAGGGRGGRRGNAAA